MVEAFWMVVLIAAYIVWAIWFLKTQPVCDDCHRKIGREHYNQFH